MHHLYFLVILFLSGLAVSQELDECSDYGITITIQSRFAPFPHPERAQGHTYADSLYDFYNHYNDSCVLLFIPKGYRVTGKTDFVFYFHGWNNNISKSIKQFDLVKQVAQSRKNVIFVFPEGPKDAPDSFGGKLEEAGVFKNFVTDVLDTLHNRKSIVDKEIGNIALAGHSGAYRVIAAILNRGGLTGNISDVYLLDGLYADFEKYAYWLDHYDGRFIHITTPSGGTWRKSNQFLQNLKDWQIDFQRIDTTELQLADLMKNRISFIFSDLSHNQVINPWLKIFLMSSQFDQTKFE